MPRPGSLLNVALLHIAPRAGDLGFNRRLIENAIETAAGAGSDFIITPELSVCGYTFEPLIGTDWIAVQPDPWMTAVCDLAARTGVVVFLATPERDAVSNRLYNSAFAIDRTGAIRGRHRKINALPTGSEAWSTPGAEASPISIDGRSVGVMICADAASAGVAKRLRARGAQFLVSPAAWAPGFHGPDGEWERATAATGLALFVCNRTGKDAVLDFSGGESVLAHGGNRLLAAVSRKSAILLFSWDLAGTRPGRTMFDRIELE